MKRGLQIIFLIFQGYMYLCLQGANVKETITSLLVRLKLLHFSKIEKLSFFIGSSQPVIVHHHLQLATMVFKKEERLYLLMKRVVLCAILGFLIMRHLLHLKQLRLRMTTNKAPFLAYIMLSSLCNL